MVICLKNSQEFDYIDIFDRAFHYGDGCFSTARIHHNFIELETRHRTRLQNAAESLGLKLDWQLLDQSLIALKSFSSELNGTLKIVISRGVGDRGYVIPEHDADLYLFYYPKLTENFQPEILQMSGVLDQAIGLTMPRMVGVKSLNRLEQVLLKQEAQQKNWLEALVTDVQGAIVEGVSSNCFIRINDRWNTPELRYNGVHGVMRAEILSRMNIHQIQCDQRFIDMAEVKDIQAVFFCNALSPMKIVETLNRTRLNTQVCFELFETLQLNQFNSHA